MTVRVIQAKARRIGFVPPRRTRTKMIAFATAGPEPMVPASPHPLAPMGLTGVGVTVRSVSMLGTMCALGMA